MQFSVCGVNFSNNISIPQVSVNKMEINLTFETTQPLTSRINPSIFMQTGLDLFSNASPTMTGENFKFTAFRLLKNAFVKLFLHQNPYKTPPLPPPSPPPHKFARKNFFQKKAPLCSILWEVVTGLEGDTILYLHISSHF